MVWAQFSLYFFLLIVPLHAYDNLLHTAIQKVPATIGEDIELRCTKIIQQEEDDYREAAHCHPGHNKNCSHVWSKDGKILDSDAKYVTQSIITHDYCEISNRSTELLKEFGPIVDFDSINKPNSRDTTMSCFASSLKIKNVAKEDFGKYSCNFSDHKDWKNNRYTGKNTVLNITLYNIDDTSTRQPKAVEYFENFYAKGLNDKMLVQCVVGGGKLQWYVDFKNCSNSYRTCSQVPLQEIDSQDFWRCFTSSEKQHSLYPNITESFVYIDKVCKLDDVRLSCKVGNKASQKYPIGVNIAQNIDSWYDQHRWRYRRDDNIAVACAFVIIIVVALLILFGIVAMVRAKLCVCCRPNSTAPLLQYIPQFQQQQPPAYNS